MATGYTTKTVTDLRKFEKQTFACQKTNKQTKQNKTIKNIYIKEEEEEEKKTRLQPIIMYTHC